MHPENLGSGLLDYLPLLLYRRGVDPVFCVKYLPLTTLFRRQKPPDTAQSLLYALLPREGVSAEIAFLSGFSDDSRPCIACCRAEIAGKWFFNYHCFIGFQGLYRHRFMGRRGYTNMNHIRFIN